MTWDYSRCATVRFTAAGYTVEHYGRKPEPGMKPLQVWHFDADVWPEQAMDELGLTVMPEFVPEGAGIQGRLL